MDPFSFVLTTVAQVGISYLFPSEGPRLKDLKVTASTYGAAIPWVFGLTRVASNMIWSMPIKEHKKKKSALGKGGFTNTYTYSCTFAMGLCKGPVKAILRIWADGKIIYDATGGVSRTDADIKGAVLAASGGQRFGSSKYRMRFYYGDEQQMPDSAIVADKGVANTPAFRGLCYIVFDDLPLQDFGSRIPQITAEVYVGGASDSVLVTAAKEADGTTALVTTGMDQADSAWDWNRSLGYLRYDNSIAQIDLKTEAKVQTFGPANFTLPGGGGITKLLTCGKDGSLYASYGGPADRLPIAKLDAYSMQMTASFGAVASGDTSNAATAFAAPDHVATAVSTFGTEYLMAVGANGQVGVLKTADMSYVWGAAIYVGGSAGSGNKYRVVGADPDTSGNPTFYVFWGSGTGHLTLSKFLGSTETTSLTIANPGSGAMSADVAIWDSAVPGVVMFWTAGTQAYISKWSADTGAEAWRTPITGYSARYSCQSRLINGQIAWIRQGKLYIVDTATGQMTDKTVDGATGEVDPYLGLVDWNDYLARYPAVQSAYFASGYKFTSSSVAYAQWDYENGGQTAGRTLTYFGASEGQGYDLPSEYAGADADIIGFDSTRARLHAFAGQINGVIAVSTASKGVTVGTIVQRLLTEGGLDPAQMDLEAIYSLPLRGYGWARGTDVKSVLDELRRLYLFDLTERNGAIVATMRKDADNGLGQVVEVIPQNVLGSSSSDAVDFWQETRLQEADLPSSISLAYMNWDDDYETSVARSARVTNPVPTMFSRQQVAMEISVVMTAKEAKAQVARILYSQWSERTKYESRLPWAYLGLDPADIVQVTMNDARSYNARLHQTEIGADFSMQIEAYAQDSGAYDNWESIVVADGGGSGLGQQLPGPGLALPFILNTPLLRDSDDTGGSSSRYYVAVGNGAGGTFSGGSLFRSTNNVDYDAVISSDNDVEWGTVVGVVPAPTSGPFSLDWKTRITIVPAVDWFDLQSITDDDLWAGANGCIVGNEVIQFRDAVENTDGTWTIWNLLRGRRGTEYAAYNHAAGERFVFLASTTVSLQADLINARGQARFFKAIGSGGSLQDATITQITYEPRDLMPYAPADIRRSLVTGGDVEITWSRRTRLGGNMLDGTGEVPLSERSEAYEVYILSAPFSGDLSRGLPPQAYLRKYATTTPQATYSFAEQGVDGFSYAASTLHVAIYQLSDAVGRGFPGVRSILASEQF